jgi:hypothetical protein
MTNQENQPQKPLLFLDEEQMEKVTGGFLNCLSCFGAPKTQETAPATAPQTSEVRAEFTNALAQGDTLTPHNPAERQLIGQRMNSIGGYNTSQPQPSTVLPGSSRPKPR